MSNFVSKARENCKSETADMNPRLNKIGLRVRGRRISDALTHLKEGTIVDVYATVNRQWYKTYHNPAYAVLCDDGVERVYQIVERI